MTNIGELFLSNAVIYDNAINYVFGLNNSSKYLDLKKINILFQKNQVADANVEFMSYLYDYYSNKKLTKKVVKPVDQKFSYSENIYKNNMSSLYENANNQLNSDQLYKDCQEFYPTISRDIFDKFLKNRIYNCVPETPIEPEPETMSDEIEVPPEVEQPCEITYDVFENYIVKLLKNGK